MADFIQSHPIAFWSAAVVLGVLVVLGMVIARSRSAESETGKRREITSAAMFFVALTIPAVIALLIAGLLPASLWRIARIVLPLGAVLIGLKYWARVQDRTRRARHGGRT